MQTIVSRGGDDTHRGLWTLYACVLVVMVGVGITLPVLPLYIERLALGAGASPREVALHIGLLTAAYPLTQLVFAPLWGRWSDRVGRRPLIVVGILGFAIAQLLFGMANGLVLLYAARLLGGALSSALFPVASAYVADATTASRRARGMMRLNTAVGLGTLVGPAAGGFLGRTGVHAELAGDHFALDAFSIPFFAASAFALVALVVALARLPAAHDSADAPAPAEPAGALRRSPPVMLLLGASAAGYFGIAMFEATFALFAVRARFETAEVGAAFALCGGVMLIAQLAGVLVVERYGEARAVAIGFGLMALGQAGLVPATGHVAMFVAVAVLGAGMALIGPSLASALSRHRARAVGDAMGRQQAAQGLGQIGGSVVGVLVFGWRPQGPYVIAAILMMVVGLVVGTRRA